MKILQITPYFYPAWGYGGPPVTAYELAKELVKRGHSVTVYTTDVLNDRNRIKVPSDGVLELEGIKVYYFKNISNWLAGKYHMCISPSFIKALRDNLKNFDVAHFHGVRNLLLAPAYWYSRKYAIPYVLHAQGGLPRLGGKRILKSIEDFGWVNGMVKNATKLIAMTSMEKEQYKSIGADEDAIEVIPSALDLSEFSDLPLRGVFREKYGISEESKVILYLGRIEKTKGIDLLVTTFAGILRDIENARLVIVGQDDGYLPFIKDLIRKLEIEGKVVYTGMISHREKLSAYVDADVHVLPRSWEPFGRTLIEACVCGTSSICSKGCGLADIIDGQAGLAVDYGKKQLGDALLYMLKNNEIRQQFGRQGKSLVLEHFSCSKMTEQVEKLYQSIAS